MTISCTHTVRGRAWSMHLGNPVDNAPYRLDRVALITLAGARPHTVASPTGCSDNNHFVHVGRPLVVS